MCEAERALEAHLNSGRFLAGSARGRWQVVAQAFPAVTVAIAARDARRVVLRFDCAGYPESPPTATVWDVETQRRTPGIVGRAVAVSRKCSPGMETRGSALHPL